VPFIRYTRDKRGYECTTVLHQYRPQQGPQRTRVLYVFRSPASLKMGRKALDAEVVEALEHTHPDLSFDWTALHREIVAPHVEPRERPAKSVKKPKPEPRPAAPDPVPIAIDDQSLLGRVAGAAEALRLRQRHADLLQRILRRARTPEDRDRLTERAARLNPDEWPDEAAVRAGLATIEAEWEAITSELPQRRRGRRGGRHRHDRRQELPDSGPQTEAPEVDPGAPEASGIMAGDGESERERAWTPDDGAAADVAAPAVDGGDDRGLGADAAGPADDLPGDR
jgi:hypothetical protein